MFLAFAGYPRDNILEHAQRADNRTVDTPEEQGQCHEQDDDAHVQGQYGRQELYPGQPPEPQVHCPRKVEEQQGDERKTDSSSDYSDFS